MSDENITQDEIIAKYIEAGKIAAKVGDDAAKKVVIGASLLEVAEFVETSIIEAGAMPAFPCNISRNEEAAHNTPLVGDTAVFGEDMVKLDIGAQIDGFIGDTAITVDLSDNPELVEASRAGLAAAIDIVHAGVNTKDIGVAIENAITEFGFKPVSNLSGHGLACYTTHAPPSIPNTGNLRSGAIIKEGDIFAIEPFATTGSGIVRDSTVVEIYRVASAKPVRLPAARAVLKEASTFNNMPFARRWIETENADMAIMRLFRDKILDSYPVLKDISGSLVSQAEHTVMVTDNGCKVLTESQ